MPFELTPQQREAVLASPGQPLHLHDRLTQKVYLVIEQGVEPTLEEEYVRCGLDLAREQITAGDLATGDVDAVIAETRRRFSQSA